MCSKWRALGIVVLGLLSSPSAHARGDPQGRALYASARTPSPDGRRWVEVRATARGESLSLSSTTLWLGQRVASPVVWSSAGDGVAFTAIDLRGASCLVVLLLLPGAAPATMSWPIPAAAQPARAVTWLGPTRVGAGPSELGPRMAVSWRLDP